MDMSDVTGATYSIGEIPDDMKDDAEAYREQLVEAVANFDDDLMGVSIWRVKSSPKMSFA